MPGKHVFWSLASLEAESMERGQHLIAAVFPCLQLLLRHLYRRQLSIKSLAKKLVQRFSRIYLTAKVISILLLLKISLAEQFENFAKKQKPNA